MKDGVIIWVVTFIGGMLLFPLRTGNLPLFESLIPVVLAGATVWRLRSAAYREMNAKHALVVGLCWMLANVIVDQFFFSWGPMRMSSAQYASDIGAAYLMLPVLAVLSSKR